MRRNYDDARNHFKRLKEEVEQLKAQIDQLPAQITTLTLALERVVKEACVAANRPEAYAVILEAHHSLMMTRLESVLILEQVKTKVNEFRGQLELVCNADSRPDLYETIIETSLALVKASMSIESARSRYTDLNKPLNWQEKTESASQLGLPFVH